MTKNAILDNRDDRHIDAMNQEPHIVGTKESKKELTGKRRPMEDLRVIEPDRFLCLRATATKVSRELLVIQSTDDSIVCCLSTAHLCDRMMLKGFRFNYGNERVVVGAFPTEINALFLADTFDFFLVRRSKELGPSLHVGKVEREDGIGADLLVSPRVPNLLVKEFLTQLW